MTDLHAIASAERDRRAAKARAALDAGKLDPAEAEQDRLAWHSIANLFPGSPHAGDLFVDNAAMVEATRHAAIRASASKSDRAAGLWALAHEVASRVRVADAVNAAVRARRERKQAA